MMQLKVELRHIQPLIWRRILVPGELTLGDLHAVLRPAMGWAGGHMHAFYFGGGFNCIRYAGTETVEDCGPEVLHENSVTLAGLLQRKGQVFTYEYDFGDGWEHRVVVERILPLDAGITLPVCVAGARACPPEDCGGVPGYASVLRVLQKASTPGERDFLEWVGEYDPEKFDVAEVNRLIG